MLACTSSQVSAGLLHAQVKPSISCKSGCPTAARRRTAASSSFSQAAVLQPDLAAEHPHTLLQKHLQTAQHPWELQQQLNQTIHRCNTFEELLSVTQQHGRALSADDITSLLYKGAMLAKSAKRLHGMNAGTKRSRNSSNGASSSPHTAQDVSRSQQLVSLCLQRLLDLSHQVTAQHLSNCLLSLAALCSRGGPATAAFAGSSSSTKQRQHIDDTHGHKQRQQQQPDLGGGLLQQLVTPASSRALEQLLVAAAPQHQLQQLLELTCSSSSGTCLAHAELHQLVNTVYSLAVLPLRPAPHVLQELLQHTQQHMQVLITTGASNAKQQQQHCRVPRLLSQLLWSAATLQILLPASWLDSFWIGSCQLMPQFSAQDVANTVWAAAALRLEPPAAWLSGLMSQIQSVSGHMTGQGLANTIWGLAVMNPTAVDEDILLHILQCSVKAAKQGNIDRQNLANIFWSVAKCRSVIDHSSSSSTCRLAVLQQLQQLLCGSSSILRSLQPRDWAELLWSCGQLELSPAPSVLQQLWRQTPAGFHTSLNPHSLVINNSSSSSRSLGGPAWSPQALSMCLAGCARIRAQPTAIWLQGFEVVSVSLLPVYSTQLLANTLWSLGQLRYRPSDTWMNQYWQQADRIVIKLQQTAAIAQIDSHQKSTDQSTAAQQQLEVAAAAAEVVMVVQAAGRLHIVPPLSWLQQAAAAVAAVTTRAPVYKQLPQQLSSITQLQTLTIFIHALSRLLHNASRVSSSDSDSCNLAGTDVQQLLKYAVQPHTSSSSSNSSLLPLHMSHMDALLLLSAVSLLPHRSTAAAADIVVLLLARCWQLLAVHSSNNSSNTSSGSSSNTTWTGRQLVQVAVSVARVVSHVTRGPVSSNRSSSSSSKQRRAATQQLWANVVELLQQAGSSSSTSNTASSLVCVLCGQLEQHLSHLAPIDISNCLVAVAKLNSSSSDGGSSSSSSVSSFTAAAGQAVSTHMGAMLPHQRAAAIASLAQLGYCPTAAWLELLLLHSSCQLSGGACSGGSMLLLLQSMPVLLRNHQLQQQHQLAGAAAVQNCSQVPSTAVVGWLRDWLDESSIRMSMYTSSQLVAAAKALQKLLSWSQQQQQQQLQVTSTWRSAFLSAVQQQLSTMSGAELVALVSSAHRLQLRPSHEWCAAVADEAAARAAVILESQQQQQGTTSSRQLKVHHVGLLALTFKQLAYRPPWPIRQQLLNAVLAQCRAPDSSSARPTALTQLIWLLSESGWYPSRCWIRYFKRSGAGRRLRLYLSKKRHRGSWRQLERRLRSWEQLAADSKQKSTEWSVTARGVVLKSCWQ